ncbi:MAG TPA: hypothetical protein VLM37_00035 [Fibrobacteraceae bacterium]|nr:hypothetical protein [Fibrobacteraceae bacterium]
MNFPGALAKALDFKRGEVVEWTIEDKNTLMLRRTGSTNKMAERERTDGDPETKLTTKKKKP